MSDSVKVNVNGQVMSFTGKDASLLATLASALVIKQNSEPGHQNDSSMGKFNSIDRPELSVRGNPLVLLNALKQIELIELEDFGGDWDEIIAAKEIAKAAINQYLDAADGEKPRSDLKGKGFK